jgi:iron complex transport system ATP-binding protein
MTIVVVLHDINVAAQFADDVIAMRDGRVVHHGPVDEVITAANLEALYETPVRIGDVDGRRVVLWE